jgi:hypothetical protein
MSPPAAAEPTIITRGCYAAVVGIFGRQRAPRCASLIDGELRVPGHHFLAVDLVPGRCEEDQAAQRATRSGGPGTGEDPLRPPNT